MSININVRLSCGSYNARALGLGITASSAEGASSAARAVCRKLKVDPELLAPGTDENGTLKFTHPGPADEGGQR